MNNNKLLEQLNNELGYTPLFPWMYSIITNGAPTTYVVKSRGLGITTMMSALATHYALHGERVLYISRNNYTTRSIHNLVNMFIGEDAKWENGTLRIGKGLIKPLNSQHKDLVYILEGQQYDRVFLDEPDRDSFSIIVLSTVLATLVSSSEHHLMWAASPNEAPKDLMPDPNFYEYKQMDGLWVTPVFELGYTNSKWGVLRKTDAYTLKDLRTRSIDTKHFWYRGWEFKRKMGRWNYVDGDARTQAFKVNALMNLSLTPSDITMAYFKAVEHGNKGIDKFFNDYV